MNARGWLNVSLTVSLPVLLLSVQMTVEDFESIVLTGPILATAGLVSWLGRVPVQRPRMLKACAVAFLGLSVIFAVLLLSLHPVALIFVVGPGMTVWAAWRATVPIAEGPLPPLPQA